MKLADITPGMHVAVGTKRRWFRGVVVRLVPGWLLPPLKRDKGAGPRFVPGLPSIERAPRTAMRRTTYVEVQRVRSGSGAPLLRPDGAQSLPPMLVPARRLTPWQEVTLVPLLDWMDPSIPLTAPLNAEQRALRAQAYANRFRAQVRSALGLGGLRFMQGVALAAEVAALVLDAPGGRVRVLGPRESREPSGGTHRPLLAPQVSWHTHDGAVYPGRMPDRPQAYEFQMGDDEEYAEAVAAWEAECARVKPWASRLIRDVDALLDYFDTQAEAEAAADARLRAEGWLLLDADDIAVLRELAVHAPALARLFPGAACAAPAADDTPTLTPGAAP